jgi:hypothetical protein
VPVLVAALPILPAGERAALRDSLLARRAALDADPSWRAWPAFHFAHEAAYEQLTLLK